MQSYRLKSLTLLLLLGFLWGTGYSIARFATTHGVPPLGYSFWQSLGPAILISVLSFSSKNKLKISTSYLRYYLICGLTGIVIPNTNMYFAAAHLPAGLLAVIVNTVPIVAYPLALIARVESFNIIRFLGVCSAILGVMFIIVPTVGLPAPEVTPWFLMALITPISFAVCVIYIARFRPEASDSLSLASGTLLASSLLLLPLVIFTGNLYQFHFPLTSADWVILLEIGLSSAGYILLFQLIKIAGPVYYSLVDTIVSLTGLGWGYLIFHEKLNSWTSIAVLLIFIGLLLVTKRQQAMVKYTPSKSSA